MKKFTDTRIKMIDAVLFLFNQNPTVVTSVAALAALKVTLVTLRTQIAAAVTAQQSIITGTTADKQTARTTLQTNAYAISAGLSAFATAINNKQLYNASYYPESDFTHLSDVKLVAVAQLLHDNANTNLAALLPYNIKLPQITALLDSITAFSNILAAPRAAIVARTEQIVILETLVKQAMTLLDKNIDHTVASMITVQPTFVASYHSSRKLVPVGSHHTALRGLVLDSVTNMPIVNAKVTIIELNRTTNTDIAGVFGITEFRNGIYTILMQAAGYNDVTMPNIEFKLGKSTDLQVELNKMMMQMVKAA